MLLDTSGLTIYQQQELAKRASIFLQENQLATRLGAQCDQANSPATTSSIAHGMTAKAVDYGAAAIGYRGDAVNESMPVAEPRRSFAPPRTIGWAIKQLHNGARVTRAGWNGKRQWLALQLPDGRSYMTLPYIFISTISGDRVPWLASQTDLLATDWQIA